ncbi:MAG: hypothetical protein EOP08_14250, partial [Proteobacteria bacterium]
MTTGRSTGSSTGPSRTEEGAMPIKGFSHVAIGVSDMARAMDFYCGVLGLEVLYDLGEKLEMDGGDSVPRRGVYLRWPGDTTQSLIVLDSQHRQGDQLRPRDFHDLGVHHFGFWVDDEIEAIYDRLVPRPRRQHHPARRDQAELVAGGGVTEREMDSSHLVDPELRETLAMFPTSTYSAETLAELRARPLPPAY